MAAEERITPYDPHAVEEKWQRRWADARAFAATVAPGKPPYYVLEMFPYPSGRIHMGHVRNYTIGDVIARQRRMAGYQVLHPIGWDAFGLPAENAAIQQGRRACDAGPTTTSRTCAGSCAASGCRTTGSASSRPVDPDYYRWEQLFFLRMLERDLAYKRRGLVNWCPQLRTVLANEQVIDGACWRCDGPVREARARAVVLPHHGLRRRAARRSRRLDGLAGARAHHAAQLDRPQRRRRDQLPARGTRGRDPRLHDAAGHALRRHVRQPGAGASAGGGAESPARPRRPTVAAFVARVRASDRDAAGRREGGVATGAYCRHPAHRRGRPHLGRQLRADGVRHRGGDGACPPTTSAISSSRGSTVSTMRVVVQPDGERLDPPAMDAAYEGPGTLVGSGAFDGLAERRGRSGASPARSPSAGWARRG